MNNLYVYKICSRLPQYLLIQKVYIGYVYFIYDKNFNVITVNCTYSRVNIVSEEISEVLNDILRNYNFDKYSIEILTIEDFMELSNGKNSV